jgi:hypothetical protein
MRRLREVTSKAVDHLHAKTATALLQARVYKQKPVHRHIPFFAPPITLIPSLSQRLHLSSSNPSPQRPDLITMSNEIVHETIKGRFPLKENSAPRCYPSMPLTQLHGFGPSRPAIDREYDLAADLALGQCARLECTHSRTCHSLIISSSCPMSPDIASSPSQTTLGS